MNHPRPDDLSGTTARRQASIWHAYLVSGAASETGREAFRAWLAADRAHAPAFARSEQLWRDLGYPLAIDEAAREDEPTLPSRRWIGVAAAIGIVIGLAGLAATHFSMTQAVPAQSFASAVGELRIVKLGDGSTVTLGGASSVTVALSQKTRDVTLERGRAYFEVAHDAERPFRVSAGTTNVTVVGTVFDIARRGDGVRISVVKGRVMVAAEAAAAAPALNLTAGQRVEADAKGTLGTVARFDQGDLAWRTGRLVFHDEPLAHVVEEINRYRVSKIVLHDKELADTRITISIPTDRTEHILSALNAIEPIALERTSNSVVVHARNH